MSGVITDFVDFGAPLTAADLNSGFVLAVAVTNLADATDAGAGAAYVGYKGRTVAARLSEGVSIGDYGAVMGTGGVAATNTAALNAAGAAAGPSGRVYVPGGVLEFTVPAPFGGIWQLDGTIYSGGTEIVSWATTDLIETSATGKHYFNRPHSVSSLSQPILSLNFLTDDEVGTPGSAQLGLIVNATQGAASWQHGASSAVAIGAYLASYAKSAAGTSGSGVTAGWPQPVAAQFEATKYAGSAALFALNVLAKDVQGLPTPEAGGMGTEWDFIIGAPGGMARDNAWAAPGSWTIGDHVLEGLQGASGTDIPYIYAFARYRAKSLPAGYANYGTYVAAQSIISADLIGIMAFGAALDLSNLYTPTGAQTWLGTTALRMGPNWLIDFNSGGHASWTFAAETVAPAAPGGAYAVGDTATLVGGTGTAPVLTISTVGSVLSGVAIVSAGSNGLWKIGDGFAASGGTLAAGGVQLIVSVQNTGTSASGATLEAAGSGFVVGEVVSLPVSASTAAGRVTQAVEITVLSVFGGGLIGTFEITNIGTYDVVPANPVAMASGSGSGTGAAFNVTWGNEGPGYVTAVAIEEAGGYSATPVGNLTQAATNGLGAGLVLAPTWTSGGAIAATITTAGAWTGLPLGAIAQSASSGAGSGATWRVGWLPVAMGTNAQNTLGYDSTQGALEYFNGAGGAANLGLIGTAAAAGNNAAALDLKGWNSASAEVLYAQVIGNIVSPTAGSEQGRLYVYTRQAGVSTLEANFSGGLALGVPSGGPKGVGALNLAGDLYQAGVQVVGARQTGWTAGTYSTVTPIKATFDYDTATLAGLAGRVLALEQAIFATSGHGLIGT